MSSHTRLIRAAYGDRRNYSDTEARSARAKETIPRTRPWERGRIGNIEKHISRAGACAPDKLYATGELARLVYANSLYDQNYRPRDKDNPPPKIQSWMYGRVWRAAPTFADRVGRATTRGRPRLWRVRSEYWFEVRAAKAKKMKKGK